MNAPSGLPTVGMSYAEIEKRAARARSVVCRGLPVTEPVPGVELFERLDQFRSNKIPITYAVQDMSSEGLTIFDSDDNAIIVALSNATYEALEAGAPRARFTLCHEFGHAVLHTDLLQRLGAMPHVQAGALHRSARTHKFFRDTEWQSNSFSSAILMPAAGLAELEKDGPLTAYSIAHRYGVSLPAAEIRLGVYRSRRTDLLR